ncbi:MAG: Gfo/Idh/MocA family oxidoreductase, partial [Actinomycetota bacterium]
MSNDRPLRLAVLGVGRIGSMHADLLQHQVEGAEVACVYDVATAVAAATAARLGCDAAATVEEIMADDEIDAVAIASSTDTHVDLLVAA